jgi:outer membrane lipoprotein-sorting protein
MKRFVLLVLMLFTVQISFAQDKSANELFYKMREKLLGVKDYIADVKMKINVSFMRIPTLYGKLYFKAPDKMKLERNGGISILPKRSINLTLNNLVPSGNAAVIDAGEDVLHGQKVRVIKVVPDQDANGIVLTKIWIDEDRLLALRTETTTRDNGTISMDLQYGRYVNVSLPDRVTFYIDVKDFKVPKGVTMDYDGGENTLVKKDAKTRAKKGVIKIEYLNYRINTGLSDKIFEDGKN